LKTESQSIKDLYDLPDLLRATEPVESEFYSRPTVDVANDLLSCILLHDNTAGMIVETEAYLGADDLAAHSSRGLTERTRVIFGPPGRIYVYLIYGIYECLNVVAERDGVPGCVLIRALAPLCGVETMRERRQWRGSPVGLANGPGKLTRALDITRRHNGIRLDEGGLTIRRWRERPIFETAATPRIGITKCADWPLRFVWKNHPCLSRQTV
jgi:DNA-3-methyladenine glycosylase